MVKKPVRACQIKAGLVTLTTLEISQLELALIDSQLTDICQQAPDFFHQTPIIISLSEHLQPSHIDWQGLTAICLKHGLQPIAIRADERWKDHLMDTPLAWLPQHKTKHNAPDPIQPKVSQQRLIIDKPVRSGQQIYAQDKDLIVLASVSQGAEVLADGDIHIYGTLRGRALAGINSDQSAQIFCQRLEAELIAIAGHYQTDIEDKFWQKSVTIALNESSLSIQTFAG